MSCVLPSTGGAEVLVQQACGAARPAAPGSASRFSLPSGQELDSCSPGVIIAQFPGLRTAGMKIAWQIVSNWFKLSHSVSAFGTSWNCCPGI